MGKPTGFLEYPRETAKVESPKERIKHFHNNNIIKSKINS